MLSRLKSGESAIEAVLADADADIGDSSESDSDSDSDEDSDKDENEDEEGGVRDCLVLSCLFMPEDGLIVYAQSCDYYQCYSIL